MLRKRQKSCQKLPIWFKASFSHFFDVFSPGWTDLFFVFCMLSGNLGHEFRVPTRDTLKIIFFSLSKGSWKSFWAKSQTLMTKKHFLVPESYYLHINIWNFPRSKIQRKFWIFHYALWVSPYKKVLDFKQAGTELGQAQLKLKLKLG